MIQLKISGRAGNQFFQYAFVKLYIKKKNLSEKINISFEHLEKKKTDNKTFVNVLDDFCDDEFNVIDKIEMTKRQKIFDVIYKIFLKFIIYRAKLMKRKLCEKDYILLRNCLQKKMNENGLYYFIPNMNDFYESKTENIIFYGSFEDNSFFSDDKEEILNTYIPKHDVLEKNKDLYSAIQNSESVCVTIRRGDFLIDKFKNNYYICTPEYFEKAIEKMSTLVKNPQYVVFSDDVEWCKNNMKFPEGTLFETPDNPIWEKIRLMYSCKHFIISNSTFSWWAQFLSRNDKKNVIAPKIWNNFEYCDLIYDKNWILI